MHLNRLTIIGVGLIGASIGLAVRKRGLAHRIIGVGRNEESLQEARQIGAIDEWMLGPSHEAYDADLCVFCTPVRKIAQQIIEAAGLCSSRTVLTDAGSTKARIVETVEQQTDSQIQYVGSHPLAGSEKKGPAHATPDLFENRTVVVTPTPNTNADALALITRFWAELGAKPIEMTPKEHDAALARTSHFPHILASALAGCLPEEFHPFAATGFRDTTRIAAGDPALWVDIIMENKQAIIDAVDDYDDFRSEFIASIEQEDEQRLLDLLMEGKKVRDALGS